MAPVSVDSTHWADCWRAHPHCAAERTKPLLKRLGVYLRQSGFRGLLLTREEIETLVGAIDPGALPKKKREIEI